MFHLVLFYQDTICFVPCRRKCRQLHIESTAIPYAKPKSKYLLFNIACPRDVIGELTRPWAPRAAWEALIGCPCSWAWGLRGPAGLRVFSTNGSKHRWVCFQESSYLPKRDDSVSREVLEEEHFSLPSNELGHCRSWRIFFSITVMKLEGCACSRCDTCC